MYLEIVVADTEDDDVQVSYDVGCMLHAEDFKANGVIVIGEIELSSVPGRSSRIR